MATRTRAYRKHHERRLKAKRRNYNNAIGGHGGLTYHTPCLCSCHMCGHQRRINGMNIQELKARAKYA